MARIQASPQLTAFLDLCGWAEGTTTHPQTEDDGYDVIAARTGVSRGVDNYNHHPFALGEEPILIEPGPPPLYTTASGRYQITLRTWLDLAATHKLGRFSPECQDRAALALLAECGAYVLIVNNRIEEAIDRASEVWDSFPDNLFRKGVHSHGELLTTYHRFLENFQD